MKVRDSLRVFLRRWPFVVVSLLVLLTAMVGIAEIERSKAQATWTVLLTSPDTAHDVTVGGVAQASQNPLVPAVTTLDVATRITAVSVSDEETTDRLVKEGATATYTVAPGVQYGSSAMTIVALSNDGDIAVRTARAVAAAIGTDLTNRQTVLGVAPAEMIGTQTIGQPELTHFNKTRVRLLAASGSAGLALIAIAVFAIEANSPWSLRRLLRRGPKRARSGGTFSILHRRWYFTAVGFVVIMGAVGVVVKGSQPVYRADSTLLVLPPHLPTNPAIPLDQQGTQNPLLSYDSSVNSTTQATTIALSDPDRAAALVRSGATGHYEITNWEEEDSPIDTVPSPTPVVLISTSASTPEAAIKTAQQVDSAFAETMDALQTALGAPENTHITVQTVTPPEPFFTKTSRVRVLAALASIGLGGLVVAVVLADRALESLGARKRPRPRLDGPLDYSTAGGPRPVREPVLAEAGNGNRRPTAPDPPRLLPLHPGPRPGREPPR
jgi:hypothetical protein